MAVEEDVLDARGKAQSAHCLLGALTHSISGTSADSPYYGTDLISGYFRKLAAVNRFKAGRCRFM